MTIRTIQELSGINADLCKTDIVYAFEAVSQYIHNKFNAYLEATLDKEVLDRLAKDRDSTPYKIGKMPLSPSLEADLDQFLDREVKAANQGLGNIFSDMQVRGLLSHLKMVLMPMDLQLGFVWVSRFSTHILNPSAFDQCVTALGLRLWFRSGQNRDFSPDTLKAFHTELGEELVALASLMKNKVHYGFLTMLAGKFMISLNQMRANRMPQDKVNNLFYRKPSYLSSDYPKAFFDNFISVMTNLFINNDADKLKVPTISTFIQQNLKLCSNGQFPQVQFRKWVTRKQDELAPSLVKHLQFMPDVQRLQLEEDMFNLTHFPSGAYFKVSAICISNFFVDLMQTVSSVESEQGIFANTYLDVFSDNHDVWVAVAINVIRNFTEFGERLPAKKAEAEKALSPVVLIQMMSMMSLTNAKRSAQEVSQIIDEAMVHIYSMTPCKIEKEMYESLEDKYGEKIDQKEFLELSAISSS